MTQLPKLTLLVIDDDRGVSSALAHALKTIYDVNTAISAESGLAMASRGSYDLVMLDLTLPDASGLSVCQQLRRDGFIMPILVLTGNAEPMSKIALLDAGADDYLTKPFSLGELKARLRVLERNIQNRVTPKLKHIQITGLKLNSATNEAIREGIHIRLRRKEYALLECLMHHVGTVVTREMLCSYVWNESGDNWTNTIDVHIKHLRDKIDRPFDRPLIMTVHGIGYKLDSCRDVVQT